MRKNRFNSQLRSTIQCEELIKRIFNLTEREIEVYRILRELGATRVDELARCLNKERSTIYRSLQKLTEYGLCEKLTKTLEKGGYYHLYECKDLHEIKKLAEECIERWYRSMKETLKLFEQSLSEN